MSTRVKARLEVLDLLRFTDHELRAELDMEIEKRTGEYCDKGIDKISDQLLRDLVAMLQERRRRKKAGNPLSEDEERQMVSAYA